MSIRSVIRGMAHRANIYFAFGAVGIPLLALIYASHSDTALQHVVYIHVMAGLIWTGFDLSMGLVIGPVIGGLSDKEKANVFELLTPKASFLIPTMATVSITTGIFLVQRIGLVGDELFGAWLSVFTAANLIPGLVLIGWQFNSWRDPRWVSAFIAVCLGSLAWVGMSIGSLSFTGGSILSVLLALAIVTVLAVEGFGLLLPGEVRIYLEMTAESPDSSKIAAIGQRNAKLAGVQGFFQLALIVIMVYLRFGGF